MRARRVGIVETALVARIPAQAELDRYWSALLDGGAFATCRTQRPPDPRGRATPHAPVVSGAARRRTHSRATSITTIHVTPNDASMNPVSTLTPSISRRA